MRGGKQAIVFGSRLANEYLDSSFDSRNHACALQFVWFDKRYKVVSGHLDAGGSRTAYKQSIADVEYFLLDGVDRVILLNVGVGGVFVGVGRVIIDAWY